MIEKHRGIVTTMRPDLTVGLPPAGGRIMAQQQLSFVDLCNALARRKVPILGFATLVLCLVAAYTFLRTPLYEGVARLQIDPSRSSSLGLDEAEKPIPTDVDSRIKTEVTIIQSDTVVMQVIKSLRLRDQPQFAGKDVVSGAAKDAAQLTAVQGRRLLERFKDSLTVKVIPNTQVVEIRFRSPDPALATDAANSLIDEYMQRNFHARVDGTAQLSQWLSRQMEEIRVSTAAAQQQFADFQKEHNLLGTDENDNVVTNRLKQLNEELTQAEADRIVKEGRYRMARSGNPVLMDSAIPNTTLQVLRTQQAELQGQHAQLSAKFGKGYPQVRELQTQLAEVNAAIEREGQNIEVRLANDYTAATAAEGMIRGQFERQKEEAYRLNENVARYENLKHQVESGQRLYDTLQLKVKEAGITSGLNSSYISVVDRAELPDKPVEPRKKLSLALGLGGGLLGGVMLGLILDSLDDTLRTCEDAEAVMALPELVSIPFLSALTKKDHKRLSPANLLGLQGSEVSSISVLKPQCAGAEAYRALGSVILLSCLDNPPKVLVVTSAMAGEGKSTISCNLAAALAQRARRVLLVDADLRCASIQQQLGMRPGGHTVFATGATQYSRYQPIKSLPTLHVVPTGFRPTDPNETLDTTRIRQLMTAWSTEYDHVIIDTPPVLLFADVLVMAARADGVVLVTRSGRSRAKASLRARNVLLRSGANILGFVLNAAKRREYYYEYPAEYKRIITSDYASCEQVKFS
jgi:succinoglycan biosynthesis transport protein ExoP